MENPAGSDRVGRVCPLQSAKRLISHISLFTFHLSQRLISERSWRSKCQAFSILRMDKSQIFGVQQQPFGLGAGWWWSVERVAEDGMTKGLHVHAELMGAPGFRDELDAAGVLFGQFIQDAVAGQRRLAVLEIDPVQRAVRPVDKQRQIDFTT